MVKQDLATMDVTLRPIFAKLFFFKIYTQTVAVVQYAIYVEKWSKFGRIYKSLLYRSMRFH